MDNIVIQVAIPVITFVIGLLFSWLLYRRGKITDRQLLKESGAFKAPFMQISFLGWPIGSEHPDTSKWFFLHPNNDNRPAIFNLKLEIYNAGDLISKDNMLTVVAPKSCLPKDTEEGEISMFPRAASDLFKWSFDELGNYGTATIIISDIPPKTGIVIKLPIVLFPTSREDSIDVPTKDGFLIQPKFRVVYQYMVSVYLTTSLGRDSYPLTIGAINASNISDAVMDVFKYRLKENNNSTPRTIIKNLTRIFTHTYEHEISNFLEFELLQAVEMEGKKFFEMKAPPVRERKIIFDLEKEAGELSSWDLLPGTLVSVVETKPIPKKSMRRKK